MEPIVSLKPVIAVAVSGLAVPLILASRKNPNLREFWSFLAAFIKFGIVLSLIPVIMSGNTIEYTLFTVLPGIELKFRVDSLGLLFATTASFLWIITTAYSIGYMRTLKEKDQTRYFACFAIALFSAIGVAFSANLFTLYLFYEILSIMTYPLVAHHEDKEGLEGGKKYLVYLVGMAKTCLLGAIVITYMTTGTLDFVKGGVFTNSMPAILVIIAYVGFLAGFAKAGIMPLHNWLPSAMVAPTPVSGLLHAVAVVKVGVFSIVRIMFDIMGIDILRDLHLGIPTALFVSFTIITASIIALTKDDLKARLAYSTVSQLSYIILGVALTTKSGMIGGMLHIANHAVSKITLFFCAGSIYVSSHLKKISMIGGIGKKMPWTMAAFTIGSFSMIGVPAFAGFTSKWYMSVGAIDANTSILMFVLLASTVLNAAYFLPVVFTAYFGEVHKDSNMDEVKESPPFVIVPIVITAVLTVVIGIWPGYFVALAERMIG
ncbi:MAG: monovalent cation/H+ antiporter subunit D family protein [Thermodesulfobacteriota bacterium]